ncbi:hypothetical protein [Halogranum gelatinilyticum]|uniref:hypothetical protein n=1 Tax=Halogranum gelatinilyticum TaxID=660521 RepID=UPI000B7FAD87|nr:hypothetical protein [Halogranum gelatinilyticum]
MSDELVDVLRYADGGGLRYVTVPAGDGDRVVAAAETDRRRQEAMRTLLKWVVIACVLAYEVAVADDVVLGGFAAVAVAVGFAVGDRGTDATVPHVVARDVSREEHVTECDAEGPTSAVDAEQ